MFKATYGLFSQTQLVEVTVSLLRITLSYLKAYKTLCYDFT